MVRHKTSKLSRDIGRGIGRVDAGRWSGQSQLLQFGDKVMTTGLGPAGTL
jgi:hypothetical protein